MTYSELQEEQRAWSLARFGKVPADLQALKVLAEIGELAEAHLAGIYGKRGADVDATAMKRDAVGDIVIALAGLYNCCGWDLSGQIKFSRKEWRKDLQTEGVLAFDVILVMGRVLDTPIALIAALFLYCHTEHIDFDAAVFDTWQVVKQREWGGAA